MNMISTGSFLTETSASNKQSELVKTLTAAWEKKNSKAARAGGVSLMALSLAACGSSEDDTPFSQADVDAAVAAVDITSDNTAVMLTQEAYDAAIAAATTSNDATITTAALTATDGTIYASVDAAKTAGINTTSADAVAAALTDASGVAHNNVDAAITSNDASVTAAATLAAEATLVAGSGFSTVADLLAAYTAAVAPEGAVSSALTTSRDIPTLTGADDTITGAYLTLGASDVIADSSTTDSDTMTVVMDLATATKFSAINIETINIDVRSATNAVISLDNVSGTDVLNVYSNYGYDPTSLTINKIQSGLTIDIATTIGLGATEVLTLTADGDSHTSAATLNMNGDSFTLATQSASTDDIDLLTINSGGAAANTVTLNGSNAFAYASTNANSITLTGDQNITLKMTDATIDTDDIYIIDNTTAGTSTLEITEASAAGASNDLSRADVDVISLKGALHASDAFVVASGARIDIDEDLDLSGTIDLAISTTASNSSVTINLDVSNPGSGGTTGDADINLTEFNTVNLGNTSTAATSLDGDLTMVVAGIGEEVDLNIDTGAGLTIVGNTSASTGTLDAVTISGAGAFTQTGTISARTVDVTSTKNVTFTGTVTADTTIDIDALRTLDMDGGIAGSFTLTGAGDADIEGTVGETSGVISITSTGSTDIAGQVTGALTAAISADETLNLQDGVTGAVSLSGAGDFAVADEITGNVSSTLSGEINLEEVIGNLDITLTANTGTVDELDVSSNITGSVELSGSGNADFDGNISGTLTVGGSVDVDLAATKTLTGALTATGSGDITLALFSGAVVAGSASGDITITGSGTQSGTIVTGSGADTITVANGDNPVTISSGAGNDTIDGALGAAAIAIDAGAGNDTITGSGAADSITGGFGSDTFVLKEITSLANSATIADTINDFSFGTSGDIINLTSFTGASVDGLAGTSASVASSASAVDLTDESIVAITDAVASDWSDLVTVVEAAVVSASGEDAFILVNNGTDARIYAFVEAGANAIVAAGELTLVATLAGVTDFTDIVDANFVVA